VPIHLSAIYVQNYFETYIANFIPEILVESSLELVFTVFALQMDYLVELEVVFDI
jgi:hypothetical protein